MNPQKVQTNTYKNEPKILAPMALENVSNEPKTKLTENCSPGPF